MMCLKNFSGPNKIWGDCPPQLRDCGEHHGKNVNW